MSRIAPEKFPRISWRSHGEYKSTIPAIAPSFPRVFIDPSAEHLPAISFQVKMYIPTRTVSKYKGQILSSLKVVKMPVALESEKSFQLKKVSLNPGFLKISEEFWFF